MIEAFDVLGLPRFLRDGAVLRRGDHAWIDGIVVRMQHRLVSGHQGHIGPERLPALVAPIPHVKRHNLAGGRIQGKPEPLLVRFLLYKAPPLIGFGCQAGQESRSGLGGERRMHVIGACRNTCDEKVQEPRETDAHGTADPTEGDALAPQWFDPQALRGCTTPVERVRSHLTVTHCTLTTLFPMAGMAIFLRPGRSTRGARLSDDHGCCGPPSFEIVLDPQEPRILVQAFPV